MNIIRVTQILVNIAKYTYKYNCKYIYFNDFK